MIKIISKSKYEAMLTQIEGLKSVCVRQQGNIEKIGRLNSIIKERYHKIIEQNKELSDELSKWKRNRDLVTGRFIKNRK